MSFKARVQKKSSGGGPKIDWNALRKQVEEGNQPAVISTIVELGEHPKMVNKPYDEETEWMKKAFEDGTGRIYDGYDNGKEVEMIEVQMGTEMQVGVTVDLIDSVVDYGGEIGEKPYRHLLNSSFNGQLKGYNFEVDQSGKFNAKSTIGKLYAAAGCPEEDHGDPEALIGKVIMVTAEKTSGKNDATYINIKAGTITPVPKRTVIEQDLVDAVDSRVIGFDDCQEEDVSIINYFLREHIKEALDYEGNIKDKLEAFEAGSSSSKSSNDEEEEKPAKKEPKEKPTKAKSKPKPAVEDDDFDDDIPF